MKVLNYSSTGWSLVVTIRRCAYSSTAVSVLRVGLLFVSVLAVIFAPLMFHDAEHLHHHERPERVVMQVSAAGLPEGAVDENKHHSSAAGDMKLSLRRLMLARSAYDLSEPILTSHEDYVTRTINSQQILAPDNDLITDGADYDNGCFCAESEEERRAWKRGLDMVRDRLWLTCSDPRALFDSVSEEGAAEGPAKKKNVTLFSRSLKQHQKVVSFSIFRNAANGSSDWWLEGIAANSRASQEIYPDWDVRVYHRYTKNSADCSQLCAEREVNPKLSLCYVRNLPRFPALTNTMGTLWRFLPMIDAGVDTFISRDADSVVNAREASAVKEWLESGKTLHVMHDHPHHGAPILAGMWGTNTQSGNKNYAKTKASLRKLARRMVLSSRQKPHKSMDQDLLANHIAWTFMSNDDYMDHSSYLCNTFGFRSRPFPTQRDTSEEAIRTGTYFVGAPRSPGSAIRIQCPPSCRPSHGKDWKLC